MSQVVLKYSDIDGQQYPQTWPVTVPDKDGNPVTYDVSEDQRVQIEALFAARGKFTAILTEISKIRDLS